MNAPHLLPKVRSEQYLHEVADLRVCTARVSSFVPGHRCSAPDTCVPAHLGNLGKGMSTKVTDLAVACTCLHCHDLIDRRDSRWDYIAEKYPAAVMHRCLMALIETQSLLVQRRVLIVAPKHHLI